MSRGAYNGVARQGCGGRTVHKQAIRANSPGAATNQQAADACAMRLARDPDHKARLVKAASTSGYALRLTGARSVARGAAQGHALAGGLKPLPRATWLHDALK